MSPVSGLPDVPYSALPPEVRSGTQDQQEAYKAALGFERLLVGQLVATMTKSAPLATGPQASMVQDALADALTTGGGLGLAAQIYRSMEASA